MSAPSREILPRGKSRGRSAKLPKMNNSERGKYYRRKYKEYEQGLETSVTQLRKQVRDLQLLMQIREELSYRMSIASCEAIVSSVFQYFLRGCSESPVVVMKGDLHTQYSRAMIENLFPHLFRNEQLLVLLLDKNVTYPCTYHFYFTANGAFHSKLVEADFVHGLQQVLGRLEDVMWLYFLLVP
ncbi:hypothetical protein ATCC90586_009622 [Pythium insidiosum]|nr:hypothetical protein ATCC90586_009622 [Pythium insidiosum]